MENNKIKLSGATYKKCVDVEKPSRYTIKWNKAKCKRMGIYAIISFEKRKNNIQLLA